MYLLIVMAPLGDVELDTPAVHLLRPEILHKLNEQHKFYYRRDLLLLLHLLIA